ncbi:unnamed protein product [Cuscuta europaea]|uniref:Uncharacterized protein n=1 Tax=Cuscuta europaea TaxID=41803 RepID=A0A9P0ZUD9_CUSEU|nr:unnamed protein product [Cuscuta europaea]
MGKKGSGCFSGVKKAFQNSSNDLAMEKKVRFVKHYDMKESRVDRKQNKTESVKVVSLDHFPDSPTSNVTDEKSDDDSCPEATQDCQHAIIVAGWRPQSL